MAVVRSPALKVNHWAALRHTYTLVTTRPSSSPYPDCHRTQITTVPGSSLYPDHYHVRIITDHHRTLITAVPWSSPYLDHQSSLMIITVPWSSPRYPDHHRTLITAVPWSPPYPDHRPYPDHIVNLPVHNIALITTDCTQSPASRVHAQRLSLMMMT